MKLLKCSLLLLAIILFSSCADTQNVTACLEGHTYGFFGGLWHGIIAPISFICSLFSDDITVWAVNNSGKGYAFGFLLGVGAFFGGSSEASKR